MASTVRRGAHAAITARSSGLLAWLVRGVTTRRMEIRLLGPVEVRDGERVVPLPRRQQRALLAALALRAGEVVSTDRLVADLWGETRSRFGDRVASEHRCGIAQAARAGRPRHAGARLPARRAARSRRQPPLRTAAQGSTRRGAGGQGPAAERSARALARARARRPRRRGLRAPRGRAPRRAAGDGAGGPHRRRARARPARRARRGARAPRRRPPAARSLPRPADARALPLRPPGRGARGLPRLRGSRAPTSSGSTPRPSCRSSSGGSCARIPSSTHRQRSQRIRRHGRSRSSGS